ncbi:MAG TPA: hypothetical protein VMI11_13615 [Actinomycetes bacterium]|nr:hypothetical protein [Actinomycetes bacterium]
MPAPLTRRAVLAGLLAGGAAAACTAGSSPEPEPTPTLTPDQARRVAAVARERELGELASAAVAAFPGFLAARRTVRFSAEHATALSETLPPSPSAQPSGSAASAAPRLPSSSATGSGGPGASRVATARSLATALLDTSDAHRAAAAQASPDLARLLVSVAASDAALAAALVAR